MNLNLDFWTPILGQPTLTGNGIWNNQQETVGLGVVALIQRDDGFVRFIKKAPRPDYEFSGLWTLPGGMVRSSTNQSWSKALSDSLHRRVLLESGLELNSERNLEAIRVNPPPVTTYHAKGILRHTLVLPFTMTPDNLRFVDVNDPSVSDSRWLMPTDVLEWLAPANRLIVGWWLWPIITGNIREALRSPLERAWETCRDNAKFVCLPLPAKPWEND